MLLKKRMSVSVVALSVLTLLTAAPTAFAQDPSGRPDPGRGRRPSRKPPAKVEPQVVTVMLTVLTDPPQASVYINGDQRGATNSEGRILFEKLPVGHYTVEVRKEGYLPMLRGFQAGSEAPTLVFKLEPNLEDYLKEFDALMSAGKLTGPETPNAMEMVDRLATKYPGRPEADRLRDVLAAKFSELVTPVIDHTITGWRAVTRAEIVKALDGAVNALAVRKEDVRFQADAAYLMGVLSLRDWQTGGRVQKGAGAVGDLLGTARAELQKAIGFQQPFAAGRYQLGLVLLESGEWSAAEASFILTSQLEPQWVVAPIGLGATYQAQGKFREAIDAYRKALEIDPTNSTAYARLGFARWSKGEKDGIKDIERAIQSDPACASAHLNLGIIYSQSKNKKEKARAETEYRTAIQLNANNLEFANSMVEQKIADLKKKKK